MNIRTILACVFLAPVPCAVLGAQIAPRVPSLRVHVTDSSNAPIAGATVSVIRDTGPTVAGAITDLAGVRVVDLPGVGEYSALIRHIGFTPIERAFIVLPTDTTVDLTVVLPRVAQTLGPVHVTAETDLKRRRLSIDANAIANSPRRLVDAMDIIVDLRPDMVYGLGGKGFCAPARDLWVNGKRIPWQSVPTNEVAKSRNPSLALPAWIKTALASIRPEDIAEMTYHDCMDMSVGKIGSDRAIFVVLKPGVKFEPGRGSHVQTKTRPDSSVPRRVAIAGRFDASIARTACSRVRPFAQYDV